VPPPSSTRRASSKRTRRWLLAVCALLVALPLLHATLSGGDSDGGSAGDRDRATGGPLAARLSERMAELWPDAQKESGHFRSAVGGGTRFGDAMVGYTLLQTGVRTHDDRLIDSGLRGLTFALDSGRLPSRQSVFETLAVAGAYNLARRHLSSNTRFKDSRRIYEKFLRSARPLRLPATRNYGNHWLVEAVAVRELLRTGLRSSDRHAVLGGQRAAAERLSADLINRRIPAMARRRQVEVDGRPTFVLSDPAADPPAYHALSLGFYARAVRLLGDHASPAARRTLLAVANASLWIAAPDGDLAYYGRNQEEAWALAGTAYGAQLAAALRESPAADDARYRALAARALERLRDAHGFTHFGLNITPAVREDRRLAARGLDPNAGGPSFAGLTAAMLEWSLPEVRPGPIGELPADAPGAAVLGHRYGGLAVVRTRNVWFAVRASPDPERPVDMRGDFGLIALKAPDRGGRWRDIMPLRPLTDGYVAQPKSAGPVLGDDLPAVPYGDRMRVDRRGNVTVTGAFRTAPFISKRDVKRLPWGTIVRSVSARAGHQIRGVTRFRFEPLRCGVRLSFPTLAGDPLEYSTFFVDRGARPRIAPRAVQDRHLRVTFSEPVRIALHRGYSSAVEPRLVRARARLFASGDRPFSVTVCARDLSGA
jgi:hypothetical protein